MTLRDCPYCEGKISRIDRNGKEMRESKYLERKACTDCQGDANIATREAKHGDLTCLLGAMGRTITRLEAHQEARP